MSEPKRYAIRGFSAALVEEENGVYVRYEDYARLKAEVERLTKEHGKAVADFWNIHAGYFRLEAEVNRLTAFTTRTIVPNEELHAENARLKAEVEELTGLLKASTYYNTSEEVTRLKAEVDRLKNERDKALTDFWYIHAGYFRLQAEVNRLTAFTTRTIIPNEELQAQVERLTKAGDAMAIRLIRCEERFNGIESAEAQMWYIAKEGGCP